MDLREINDALSQVKADVLNLTAESEHRKEMLDDVVKSCIQACPEQSSWKCESPAVFVRHLLSMRDAEIARLNGIIDAEREMQAKLVAEGTRLSTDLAAARAALAVEREACEAWRKAWKRYDETRTVPAYSRMEDAADNHDARRAAEAKASRGGEGGA